MNKTINVPKNLHRRVKLLATLADLTIMEYMEKIVTEKEASTKKGK